jgi:hypothetical protein
MVRRNQVTYGYILESYLFKKTPKETGKDFTGGEREIMSRNRSHK